MRIVPVVAALLAAMLFADVTLAQGGGGRGRGRPEEITNRVGVFFTTIAGPATDGDKVADLATVELARNAASAGQPVVLYLVDSGDDEDVRNQFERQLFGHDEVGIELLCFHCGRIDLAKETALQARYGKQAPLFVVFDGKGRPSELSMAGYKPAGSAFGKLLEKQAAGSVKPSLAAFAKNYGDLVRDLEQLLAKKKMAQQKQARAGGDAGKRAEADKDLAAVEAEEKKLLAKEKDLLGKVRLPERGDKAERLGAPSWGRGRDGGRNDPGRPKEGGDTPPAGKGGG
ncbi:MAG: hypothetical protein FJ265_14005 [Planctomycetes bacterium]|nr:hypothetical protein [Planctomycetota bacterium]